MHIEDLEPLQRAAACVRRVLPDDAETLRLLDHLSERERTQVFELNADGSINIGGINAWHRWVPASRSIEPLHSIARAVAQPGRPIDVSVLQPFHPAQYRRRELFCRRVESAVRTIGRHAVLVESRLRQAGLLEVRLLSVSGPGGPVRARAREKLLLTWYGPAFMTADVAV